MDKYELYFICKRKSNRSKIKVFFKHQETNHKEDMQHSEKKYGTSKEATNQASDKTDDAQ